MHTCLNGPAVAARPRPAASRAAPCAAHPPHPTRWRTATTALAGLALLALTGCAGFSPDGGFGTVDQLARERIGQAPSLQRTADEAATARDRVAALLQRPLTADSAVGVALLNNPRLQAAYARLGVAEADLVRASRPTNPSISLGRLSGGGGVEIDRAVLVDVLGLLTLPAARAAGQQQFSAAQLQAADATVAVAAEARQAFYVAVAAQQLLGYFQQVQQAADTASDLARRMQAAGNFSRLAQLREQAFQADATAQRVRAQQQALAAREQLVRALGLQGPQLAALRLPDRLPDLPAAPWTPRDAEQTALDQRLDVRLARLDAEATARALGLTQSTRLVNVLHAGLQDQRATGEQRRRGVEVELELPLFDAGTSRVARAEAIYREALQRASAVAVQAQSEVREAHAAYRAAYDLARHDRDTVVPLRRQISDEQLLRYNGMLSSVFELLADARAQIAAVAGAVASLRDHWIAESRLQTALTGRSPGAATALAPATPAAAGPADGH